MRLIVVLFSFLTFANISQAQDLPETTANKAFFVELLGNGLIFSFNMDSRFTSRPDGLGGRLGIGYVGSPDEGGILTIPAVINYLAGKDGKYFEVGLGATYISGDADLLDDDDAFSDIAGTMTFMYRSQPVEGGFMWRIGFTPILAEGVFIPYWFGFGIGYAF
jgi:hypothetical protein